METISRDRQEMVCENSTVLSQPGGIFVLKTTMVNGHGNVWVCPFSWFYLNVYTNLMALRVQLKYTFARSEWPFDNAVEISLQ